MKLTFAFVSLMTLSVASFQRPADVRGSIAIGIGDTISPVFTIPQTPVLKSLRGTKARGQKCGQGYVTIGLARRGVVLHLDSISVFVCSIPDTTRIPPPPFDTTKVQPVGDTTKVPPKKPDTTTVR